MPFILYPIRIYRSILFLFLALLFITFSYRASYFDEAWFAEQSFWFIRDGQVRSELFRGYNGWETSLYVFHKLFVYAGALVMSITGISVASSKLVSIFFGLLGGYLVWQHGQKSSREQQWLSVLLYFGCGTLIRYISVNRPEAMCMTLGFASYLCLDPPHASSRPKPILAGILASLAALTHLNGLIYLLAGASWLYLKTGWRPTSRFAIVGALTLSLYGLDAFLDGNLAMLVKQFLYDPATQQNLHLSDKLSVLADYHRIFFYGQNEIALTALAILCGIAFRHYLNLTQPIFLYTLLLIGSFWLLTKSITDIYFLLFIPWLAILTAHWLTSYLPAQPIWQKKAARILLILYGLIAGLQFVNVLTENKNALHTEAHNALLANHMPNKHAKVIAPLEFFFGQMDNYKILGLTYFYLLEREKGKIPLDTFFRQADQARVEYIISDHRLNASYDIPIHAPARIGVYQRIFQDSWNTIYARQHR
ncbi:glycosyltransferase family 39 protein [Spirosoma sp. KCTC 42546]|uniref:ArnT family glycosyltransferase n=1 Tax=Spirosoma sp. KCTC 42546 TaxID=2520506 RepID=UPI00115AF2D8|nr:glycosyltransferase family 39 protein [Spirosoma sp. KCTC 42546]QDK82205.1 glycosyltransferase family 39 protein [Spirosoma sp. KCTC 42546]